MSSNTSVTIYFTVANAGAADAHNVAWKVVRADGSLVAQDVISSMPSGATVPLIVSDGAQGVNQTFTVSVDPDGLIAESHEDNNTMTITSVYVTTAVPLNGDLALNGVHNHGAVYAQDPSFHLFIANNSDQDLSGITVTVRDEASGETLTGFPYSEGTIIPAHAIGPRNGHAGSAEEDGLFVSPWANSSLPKPSAGRHVYHVILDPDNHFSETNEGNNDWRLVVNVPAGYGFWPLQNGNDLTGNTYKTDVMFEDPHFHPADTQRYITFHGWLHNFHPSKTLVGHDLINTSDPAYPGVSKRIVPFVLKREGVPVAVPAPGYDPNRQINYGVTADGKAYFILLDTGIAVNSRREYLFIVQEPQSIGEVNYSIDLDPDNVIDEQYEGTDSTRPGGSLDNNHASWVVVMDPLGTSG
ncbi:MAG: hypothetical protein H0W83_13550 [Planctomycetes bacterium]|nr:hypothetical protein [Planctomycetota bacterium]